MVVYRKSLDSMVPYSPGVYREGAIKLASNENPLGASPKAIEAMIANTARVSLYPDGGCIELRNALADKYSVTSDRVIVANGSDEIFVLIAGSVIDPDDEMITSEVTFSEYAFAARVMGGKAVFAPLKNNGFDLPAISKMVSKKTKWICIANPNNPTGTIVTHNEITAFMDSIPSTVLVLLDEAYSEYVTSPDYPRFRELIDRYPNLCITRTFSKIYGLAGLRVGYAIGSVDTIHAMQKSRQPFNVNYLAQKAAVAALDDRAFVEKSIRTNEAGKKYLYARLDELKLSYVPTESNFIFIRLPMDGTAAFEKLMDLGVTIRPLRSFGVPDAIRLTIGTQEQNEFFISKLKILLS